MRGVVQPPGFDIPLRNKEKEVVAWARCSEMHKNEVMKYTWHLSGKYARANIERKNVFMHAFIIKVLEGIEVKKGEVIDHFNPEGGPNNQLDNRVERLRVVSVKQNGQNQSKRKDVSSKYMGVSYDKASGMWHSSVQVNGKRHRLGMWENEKDAAKARDTYLLDRNDYMSSLHKLNFPDETAERLVYVRKRQKTSSYRGVSKTPASYAASIIVDKKAVYLGRDVCPETCARMYDAAVVKYNMPQSWLNFPDENPAYVQVPSSRLEVVAVDETTLRIVIANAPETIALIDKASYERIRVGRCYVKRGYVQLYIEQKSVALHRFLMQTTDASILVDHIDNNPLNNKLSNLRLSDYLKNASNQKLSSRATSKYLGVSKQGSGFCSRICFNSKRIRRTFASESIAAGFRELFILKMVTGSDMKMNFKWDKQHIDEWTAYLLKLGHNFDELELK
jgi:hypothetical protein